MQVNINCLYIYCNLPAGQQITVGRFANRLGYWVCWFWGGPGCCRSSWWGCGGDTGCTWDKPLDCRQWAAFHLAIWKTAVVALGVVTSPWKSRGSMMKQSTGPHARNSSTELFLSKTYKQFKSICDHKFSSFKTFLSKNIIHMWHLVQVTYNCMFFSYYHDHLGQFSLNTVCNH